MADVIEAPLKRRTPYFAGAICGLAAVSIWAGWMAVTRLGVMTSLTVYDLTMLRFGTAGLLLLPVLVQNGLALERLGWWRLAVLVFGAGAPYSLVAASGLRFAPAVHGGILIPGVMPLFVALLSAVCLKETFSAKRKAGYILIGLGIVIVVGIQTLISAQDQIAGPLLFLSAAFMWACYTIVLRQSGLAPLHGAAIVSVGSSFIFLPVYLFMNNFRAPNAPLSDILFQAAFQGIAATVIALFLYGKAISILGGSAGAAFGALVPALAALLAIPIMHEVPSSMDWLGVFAVTIGVYLASGGPLPQRKRSP
ncbi:DMT family transporter [Agrobacterium cavarae]|uniref:DMT family transporter n=1 Tax=Agrobacterium cavarae TaxID=2528239 RepID=UPI003FD67E86